MASSKSKHLIVVAIDFGTTFSGYAYSTKDDYAKTPKSIWIKPWQGTEGLKSAKAPTCILFDKTKTFDSFGYDAEDKYAELASEDKHNEWYFFRNFKMELHDKMEFPSNFQLHEENGKSMEALDVFSAAIKFMRDEVYKRCKAAFNDAKDSDFLNVLTVPAIWNEPAKQFMRDAAEKAGIPTDTLLICLEPEAASIFCNDVHRNLFHPGSKYLIVDAGGGTVDTTVHEVTGEEGLKELTRASGGHWGGTQVDQEFFNFLSDVCGQETIDRLKQDHMEDFLEIRRVFEVNKRKNTSKIRMRLPWRLLQKSNDEIASRYGEAVKIKSDKIDIGEHMIKSFYKPSCDQIAQHIQYILGKQELRDVKTILMVGGFSESLVLRDAICSRFEKTGKQVIVPLDAGVAVLNGAVLFGHNPMVMNERVCRYTYGIHCGLPFRPGVDPESTKYTDDDGKVLCDDRFDIHVRVGQQVKNGVPQTSRNYIPVRRIHSTIPLTVYASTEKDPVYVTDPSCTNLGTITVGVSGIPLAEDEPLSKRTVEVQLTFGGTELTVDAKVKETGKVLTAKMNLRDE